MAIEKPMTPFELGPGDDTEVEVAVASEDEPTIEEFFSVVLPGKLTGDVVLVAHNAPFDARFFGPWIETLRGTLDTLRLSRRYFPEAQNHKLQTLRYTFGLDAGAAHSAAGDVRVLHHLTRVLVEKSGMSLAELFTDSKAPLFVHHAPFGKHKGKLMTDVPLDYLRWMKGLDNLDPDLTYTINKILETT